jgi:hypothetical protein
VSSSSNPCEAETICCFCFCSLIARSFRRILGKHSAKW